jgi:hypothetical protein
MAASVVYSGVFGAVLASVPSVRTRMIVLDTAVVDLTEELTDSVDLLFASWAAAQTSIAPWRTARHSYKTHKTPSDSHQRFV